MAHRLCASSKDLLQRWLCDAVEASKPEKCLELLHAMLADVFLPTLLGVDSDLLGCVWIVDGGSAFIRDGFSKDSSCKVFCRDMAVGISFWG